jgi:hypothetical protein
MSFKIAPRELLFKVVKMSPTDFRDFIQSEGIGLTRLAYNLGEAMNISDLSSAEACHSKAGEMYRRVDKLKDLDSAITYASMGQFINEAMSFFKALREAKMGTSTSIAASNFGVDAKYLSEAVHRRL